MASSAVAMGRRGAAPPAHLHRGAHGGRPRCALVPQARPQVAVASAPFSAALVAANAAHEEELEAACEAVRLASKLCQVRGWRWLWR